MAQLIIFLVAVAALSAQALPWNLPAEAEFQNRYEGVMPRQVANPDFELLSFVASSSSFRDNSDLKIDFFLPAPAPAAIRAQELRDDKYYRMQSKPASWTANRWNTFAPWPVTAVIGPKQVARDNIGVVVALGDPSGGSSTLAPAFVYGGSRPAAAGYTMVFRTRMSVRRVDYTLRAVDKGAASVWSRTADGDFIRGTPIYLDVPAAMLAEGRYALQLTCVPVSATAPRIERQFTFNHAH